MTLRLGLSHGYRTSGGGSHVNSGLLQGLEEDARCDVVPFVPGEDEVPRCDVVLCTGTRAVRAPGAKTILWPLNVAPLEPETVAIASTDPKSWARYRLLPIKLRRSLQQCDGLAFGSQYAADLHRDRFRRAAGLPYTVVRTGMPSLPVERASLHPEPGRVLMVSHLYPYKLVVEAVQAMARVREQHPQAQLRIAGKPADARYAEVVRRAVEDSNGAAVLLGGLGREELMAEYAAADIALLTSVSENAGSFHLFDAAAYGLPIVASDRSSTPSVMGEAASYVDPTRPEEVAREVARVLAHPQVRAERSAAAQQFADAAPTWEERASTLITFAEELVGS